MIGEITRFNHSTLSKNKSQSIMPEFLFFHELSGQGILRYEDFNYILKRIPYKIKNNISFDYIHKKIKKFLRFYLVFNLIFLSSSPSVKIFS